MLGREPLHLIDVALRVVVMKARTRIDPFDCADDFGCEQHVVGRNHLQEELDAGSVVDTGVEEHVVHQLFQRRAAQLLC